MSSQKQIDANRANAQDAVLPFEDKDQFDEIAKSYEEHYQPLGPVEVLLVQQIVMAAWRLYRVRAMETAAFELRLAEHASGLDHECRGLSGLHRLASVFLRDVRDANPLTVLDRYETRVERSFYRALHELQRLQADRAKQSQSVPAALPDAPAPASENDSAKQSQFTPDPMPQKDLTPLSSPSFVPSCLCGAPRHATRQTGTVE